MKIKITENHIKKGKPANTYCCPIALALKENGYEDPTVGASKAYAVKDGNMISLKLSDSAIRFIKKFDKNEKVEPFEFEFEEGEDE